MKKLVIIEDSKTSADTKYITQHRINQKKLQQMQALKTKLSEQIREQTKNINAKHDQLAQIKGRPRKLDPLYPEPERFLSPTFTSEPARNAGIAEFERPADEDEVIRETANEDEDIGRLDLKIK